MATSLTGASVWEEELYQHLVSHEDNEANLLAEYQDAARTSQSPAFEYLASLVAEDEVRHHRLFGDLASALKYRCRVATRAAGRAPAGPLGSRPGARQGADRAAARAGAGRCQASCIAWPAS